MFGTKPTALPAPTAPPAPPTLEQVFNGAQASAAYAKGVFQDAVDELTAANDALDDVVLRATSEIDRLARLRDEALADRRANAVTVENLQALIG